MDRWTGRIAVVTGAVGGIGSAIIREFVKYNIIVVGIDRDEQKLSELGKELNDSGRIVYHGIRCDLTDEEEINVNFKRIEEQVGPISILINSAVYSTKTFLLDICSAEINEIFQTNVIGPILCIKQAVNSMLKNNIDDGHIINLSSVSGILPPILDPRIVPVSYVACKHALGVVSSGILEELRIKESSIKITDLCPSWVKTNLCQHVANVKKLEPEDIACTCISILQMPKNIQIPQLIVKR